MISINSLDFHKDTWIMNFSFKICLCYWEIQDCNIYFCWNSVTLYNFKKEPRFLLSIFVHDIFFAHLIVVTSKGKSSSLMKTVLILNPWFVTFIRSVHGWNSSPASLLSRVINLIPNDLKIGSHKSAQI